MKKFMFIVTKSGTGTMHTRSPFSLCYFYVVNMLLEEKSIFYVAITFRCSRCAVNC
ncbi:conserved hypothetical protein [Xenorhabdus nematophila F1]|uniref:Uncharacterized protein n=1 Tax=Xenorhabdus nematophila (strain ATCC 19061 / DSM 3370 / CCUG 14189 / LMG 1036 / NCIMB 9965 / AN6) TaxID=406817 RepID=D3VJD5_XENNA|nr:hypothetical protein XNC1_0617 [Xenorhabdus nematophila ATCC 19061]CCW31915.1 conserved hypothetical protein [Xenorhabdus nematophila F1]